MKRVRVSPGKFVVVPRAMVDKAARVLASSAFTREQIRELAAAEPDSTSGVLLGKSGSKHEANKPLPTESDRVVECEPTAGRIVPTGGSTGRASPKRKAS
jgi:hypothetical protein